MIGVPAKPGCVVPSIVTCCVIAGRSKTEISWKPEGEMLKLIVSAPANAFASSIAARRVQTAPAVAQTPLPGVASGSSAVELTVNAAADVGVAGAVPTARTATPIARTRKRTLLKRHPPAVE
jgi:hypothetical protein